VGESVLHWQPTGPNAMNHRDDASGPASRHGSLNSLFQVAFHLPSSNGIPVGRDRDAGEGRLRDLERVPVAHQHHNLFGAEEEGLGWNIEKALPLGESGHPPAKVAAAPPECGRHLHFTRGC